METGKVPNDILMKLVLNKLKPIRKEILIRPKVGEDCCAVDFGEDACILSSDPVTGAVNEIGRLAVHISCNDIASCGAQPLGLLATILVPPGTEEEELETIMTGLTGTAYELNVEIIGGHTEITTAVNRPVIVTTAVGKIRKQSIISSSGANAGDDIILTKAAGIEGTAIIALDKESELKNVLSQEIIDSAKKLVEMISVVPEGIIAGENGATSMHDVTEGGVLGAIWEISEASLKGVNIYAKNIPILPQTSLICEYYKIDPLKLISSGSMIITCKDGKEMVKHLNNAGIAANIIGKITMAPEKVLIEEGGRVINMINILQPGPDELYKVIGSVRKDNDDVGNVFI